MKESNSKNQISEYLAKGPKQLIATWKDKILCSVDSERVNYFEISRSGYFSLSYQWKKVLQHKRYRQQPWKRSVPCIAIPLLFNRMSSITGKGQC